MDFICGRAGSGRRTLIANHNLHSLHLVARHPEMKALYDRADLVEIDSMPLIFWAKLMGFPARRAHRCTYLDWRERFWRAADAMGWRVFYLGGAEGVAARAADRLRTLAPGATIQVHHGHFDLGPGSADDDEVLEQIIAFSPHVLFVGMGMPRQEIWIERRWRRLPQCLVLPVGAAFDYEADAKVGAPRWLGRMGLEWAFRLVTEPRRLFRRYLLEPWSLAPAALADVVRYRMSSRRRTSGGSPPLPAKPPRFGRSRNGLAPRPSAGRRRAF
jgi:N-acetylglucosaminyldiphosphoundecaprenol N-acetyl-beta-D-mannosaminyltransferase